MTILNKYRKTLLALVGVGVMILGTELGTDSKWYSYAVAALIALGVYAVPNKG